LNQTSGKWWLCIDLELLYYKKVLLVKAACCFCGQMTKYLHLIKCYPSNPSTLHCERSYFNHFLIKLGN
jgi:hypothetical protein